MQSPRYLWPADYYADPAAHFWNGRTWVYPSHDRESGIPERDNGDHFDMKDYHVLSIAGDPMDGEVTDHGKILDLADIPWAKRQLWDSDVFERGGKYHLVFCAKDKDDVFRLGIAVADRPEGPFVPDPEPMPGSYSIDPCAFKDDDGEVYVAFGGLWGGQLQRYRDNKAVYSAEADKLPVDGRTPIEPRPDEPALCAKIARLSEDGHGFAEAPRDVVILVPGAGGPSPVLAGDHDRRFFEASWIFKKDGRYYFTYSTGDTHLLCWAVSDSVYGPYTYGGVMLEPQVGWTTHHSVAEVNGKWYLFHHDSALSGGRTWLRSVKVKPLPKLKLPVAGL